MQRSVRLTNLEEVMLDEIIKNLPANIKEYNKSEVIRFCIRYSHGFITKEQVK